MQIENYLKEYQPKIYETFVNSMNNNRLSHAYLLCGELGTPLLESAKYLAKSILCDNPSPLACDACITCIRIDSNNYPDFIVIDGSESLITDKDIEIIQEQFKTEPLEKKGIMIYVLHLVENITTKAINSILKMLEEPTNQVYAILTTHNKNRILPTIISRCQTLQLNSIPRKEVITKATQYGVKQDDAELLSYFYNDAELIYDYVNNQDNYSSFTIVKALFDETLDTLSRKDKNYIIFYFEDTINGALKNKQSLLFYLDFLIQAFEEMFNLNKQEEINLTNYATILLTIKRRLNSIENILLDLMKQKGVVNLNTNISLIIDHIAITITKGLNDGK